MTAGRSDRRGLQIRRRGRHASPSPVEKVAVQAGKAAPAVAIAGALVTVPQAGQALAVAAAPVPATADHQPGSTVATAAATPRATLDSFAAKAVTVAAARPARHAAAVSTYYTVRSGDSLSAIASRFYHQAGDWHYLWQVNRATVANPNVIYAGERLLIPATVAPQVPAAGYRPRHAKRVPVPAKQPRKTTTPATRPPAKTTAPAAKATAPAAKPPAAKPPAAKPPATRHPAAKATPKPAPRKPAPRKATAKKATSTEATRHATVIPRTASGGYSCSGLEALWEQAGGSASTAFMAAEIAMAESGGNPNAISPTDDYGLWQINASNGSLATLSPTGNARSAVLMSSNGRNWDPWTTYYSGAYHGRC